MDVQLVNFQFVAYANAGHKRPSVDNIKKEVSDA